MFQSNHTHLRCWILSLLMLGLLLCSGISANASTMTFSFILPSDCTTSAGAFDSNGNLIRTLWRRVRYVAGPHTQTWNGLKDDGSTASPGNYSIRVLYHDVQYVWDGIVGSTSSNMEGNSAWYTNSPPQALAIDGTNAYVANGATEGSVGVKRFNTTQPQASTDFSQLAYEVAWRHIATDGTRTYIANTGHGWDNSNSTFVIAHNVSDSSEATFASGQSLTLISSWNHSYASCIDVSRKITNPTVFDAAFVAQNAATGIAVQKSGSILAVSHGPLNVVRLFDKTSGASLGNITVTTPGALAFTNTGDLLVCSGSSIKRYTGVGSTNTLANTINTGQPALNVAAHPTTGNDVVIVAVGGTSQQIKGYTSAGAALWTYGSAGGYNALGPTIANNRFQFGDVAPLAMQSDGSFWIYDSATLRMLHISATRTYLEQIAWLYYNYTCSIDQNAPTRVFGKGWLEYQVDYTKPLLPGDPQATGGNKSWKLVRNWAAGAPSKYMSDHNGLNTVATLTNPANTAQKRTYGLIYDSTTGKQALVELPASGPLRDTGIQFDNGYAPNKAYSLYGNGDLRYATYTNDVNNNPIQTVYKQVLQSFDGSGNPVWGAPVALATMPAGPTDPIGGRGWPGGAPWQFPVTASNTVVSFDQSVAGGGNTGFHLGGAQVGGSGWKWKAAPAVTNNVPLDGLGSFDISNGIQYGGNKVMATGRNVVYGYHGEFWNNSQANQYMHFYDDGLFVGQFGVPGDVWQPGTSVIGGKGGNAMTPSLVEVNGETYLWHGNESPIGGIQRWHLVGANQIREMSGTGTLNDNINLYDLAPDFPTGLTATPGTSKVDLIWQAVPGATSYKVKRATRSGGPYSTIATVTTTTRSVTGLTNNTPYYFVVSAVNASSVESSNSNQAKAVPFNSTVPVQLAGQAACSGHLDLFNVDSSALAKGQAATYLGTVFDRISDLSFNTIGTKGYVIYGWSGADSVTSNLLPGITVTPDNNWQTGSTNTGASTRFFIDGQGPSAANGGYHALKVNDTNHTANININVSDTNWHYMTVFSPDRSADPRDQVISLTPQGQTTPSVSYTTVDNYTDSIVGGYAYIRGYSHIYQFRFKGNVTLKLQSNLSNGTGLIGGIFFDDTPASYSLGTGLTAKYYSDMNLTNLVTTRIDPTINFVWGIEGAMSSVGPDNFSVRWTGKVQAVESGTYTFTSKTDDGVRVWVNNQLLIDYWQDSDSLPFSGNIALTAGQKYDIKMEYFENLGWSMAKLAWRRPGQSTDEVIPQANLFP